MAQDNGWTLEIWLSDFPRQPEVLVGIGVLESVDPVELTVETLAEIVR